MKRGRKRRVKREPDTACPQCGGPADTRTPRRRLKPGQTYYFREFIKCRTCRKQTNVESSKRMVLEGRTAANCENPDDPRCGCALCEGRNRFD